MARKPMVAGNWKMHKTVSEAVALVSRLEVEISGVQGVDVLVCPPYVALEAVSKELAASNKIQVGAQNVHWEVEGAFTGEISPPMLQGLCSHVIIGHSERRTLFGETDEMVNQRIMAALAHNLIPILCVGETLEEKEAGKTADVVSKQVRQGLANIAADQVTNLILAYEPVWAIGTGKAASAEGANDVIEVIIRPALEHLFGAEIAAITRVLYGGSIKPDNAAELFGQSDIDGGLVGGASLEAESFGAIVKAAV